MKSVQKENSYGKEKHWWLYSRFKESKRKLVEQLNVSDKTVSRWERNEGTPDLPFAISLNSADSTDKYYDYEQMISLLTSFMLRTDNTNTLY